VSGQSGEPSNGSTLSHPCNHRASEIASRFIATSGESNSEVRSSSSPMSRGFHRCDVGGNPRKFHDRYNPCNRGLPRVWHRSAELPLPSRCDRDSRALATTRESSACRPRDSAKPRSIIHQRRSFDHFVLCSSVSVRREKGNSARTCATARPDLRDSYTGTDRTSLRLFVRLFLSPLPPPPLSLPPSLPPPPSLSLSLSVPVDPQ